MKQTALFCLAVLGLCLPAATAAEARRPNILFILTDDQSPFDFKFYNPKSPLDTPNIYLLDVLATTCDLAGIPAPDSNEGISFKPVLMGQRNTIRDTLYGVYNGGTKPGIRCVRKGDWKLIQYDVLGGGVRENQLFNLAENPDEFLPQHRDPAVTALTGVTPAAAQTNLAGDPKYAAKLAEMQALLLAEMRRLDDPWRLWNQPDDGLTPPASPAAGKATRKKGAKASKPKSRPEK